MKFRQSARSNVFPEFSWCKFYKLDLEETTFDDTLKFNSCNFTKKLNLSKCHITEDALVEFNGIILPDTIDLSYSKIESVLDLTQTLKVNGRCYLNLWKTDFKKIILPYRFFKLYFDPAIARMDINRDRISKIYVKILADLQSEGYRDSYERLDIEYQLWKARREPLLYIDYIWWQFGYAMDDISLDYRLYTRIQYLELFLV